MINSIEYSEIYSILKDVITDDKYLVSEGCFNIKYIKDLVLSNESSKKLLDKLKEKREKFNLKENNIIKVIQQTEKKQTQKETKIFLNSLTKFSLFYNDPKYICDINLEIYAKILNMVRKENKDQPLFSFING
jgi:hypothetical protein